MNISARPTTSIIGAGSAGAALANRLTESGRHQVLLLEAGGETHPLSRVPISFARFINRPGVNWLYASEPEPNTGGRNIPVPRGKMLGGSSAINGMVWVRGQRQDYDHWAQLGNRGWSWQDVLPVFKGIESYSGGTDEVRGRSGPVKINDIDESGPLYDSLFAAAESIGIPRNPDYNGGEQEGIAMTQCSIERGLRMSTARVYLDPARARRNFRGRDRRACAQCLLFEGKRCVGVRYTMQGQTIRGARSARSDRVGRLDRLAATAGALRRRAGGAPQGARHHGGARAARRRREPARPLGAAHEVACRPPRRDFQRARARLARAGAGAALHRARARASSAIRPRRCAPSSRPARASTRRTPCWRMQPMLVTPDVKIAKEAGITVIAHQLRPESKGASTSRPRTRASRRRSASTSSPRASTANACSRRCASRGACSRRRAMAWLGPEEIRARAAGAVGRRNCSIR